MSLPGDPSTSNQRAGSPSGPITLGLVKLTDAAPLVVAKELGFFAEEGLEVRLTIEPSWANLADKLSCGLIDGAVSLGPLAFAISLGLRGIGTPLIVPMTLSRNGNTVTLAKHVTDKLPITPPAKGLAIVRQLRARGGERLRLGIVHAYSTHNLLLRYWLAAGGLDPDADVALAVVPPAQMVEAMRRGRIHGFCAGAPWGAVAEHAGLGRTVTSSYAIWNNHPEKVFAVRQAWAERNPTRLRGVLRALLRAAEFCDATRNAAAIAHILSHETYFGVDAEIIATSLPGPENDGGSPLPGRSVFFRGAANCPWYSDGIWILRQMLRWDYLAATEWTDEARMAASLKAIYRPDLYAETARALGLPVPGSFWKREGEHAAPWPLSGAESSIEMLPDLFCDGTVFDLDPSFRAGLA